MRILLRSGEMNLPDPPFFIPRPVVFFFPSEVSLIHNSKWFFLLLMFRLFSEQCFSFLCSVFLFVHMINSPPPLPYPSFSAPIADFAFFLFPSLELMLFLFSSKPSFFYFSSTLGTFPAFHFASLVPPRHSSRHTLPIFDFFFFYYLLSPSPRRFCSFFFTSFPAVKLFPRL